MVQTGRLSNKKILHSSIINFLETNGKNLREFYLHQDTSKSPNLVTKLCPSLRKLSISFESNESETLKTVFSNCKYLESLRFRVMANL